LEETIGFGVLGVGDVIPRGEAASSRLRWVLVMGTVSFHPTLEGERLNAKHADYPAARENLGFAG
jgi:hypothetical protein